MLPFVSQRVRDVCRVQEGTVLVAGSVFPPLVPLSDCVRGRTRVYPGPDSVSLSPPCAQLCAYVDLA